MRKRLIISRIVQLSVLLILLTFQPILGQNDRVEIEMPEQNRLTIDQSIQLAVVNNPEIKRAILSVEDANQQVRLAWSEVLPDVTSSATYTRNVEIPVNFVPAQFFDPNAPPDELVPLQFGTDNNWQGGVTVSQTIFRGEAIIGISSSSLFKSAQIENLRATVQQVITLARKQFHAVLMAREQLRLQQATVERIRENFEENQARFEAGLIEEYDVLRLEVQLANQEPQLKDAEIAVDEAVRQLNVVMGLPVDLPIVAVGSLAEYEINGSPDDGGPNSALYNIVRASQVPQLTQDEALNVMRRNRGDLRSLDVQDNLKNREISAIKSRFLPTISADYNLQWTAAQPGVPRPFENSVRFQTLTVNVSLPLFTGFERLSNLTTAKIEKKDIAVQRWAAEKTALDEYTSTTLRLQNLQTTASARQEAVVQAQRGYEIALNRYENGLGSQIEVTEAELQVREAELNYAMSIADFLNTKADYDLATGMVPMIDETEYDF